MTKNKYNTPSNDGEFLDSNIFNNDNYENGSLESLQNNDNNSENEQEEISATNEDDATLDNEYKILADNKEITIPLTLSKNTSTKSTNKYEVILTTPTKYILNIDGNGASYTHNTESLSLNFKAGDFIVIPKEGE